MKKSKKKLLLLPLCFVFLLPAIYIYLQYKSYPLTPLSLMPPVYQEGDSLYYCDPQNNHFLLCETNGKTTVVLPKTIHHYCISGNLLLYSTKQGLFLSGTDGSTEKQLAGFPSSGSPFGDCYNNFFIGSDFLLYSYQQLKQNGTETCFYRYDISNGKTQLLLTANKLASQTLQPEAYWADSAILFADSQAWYYYDDSHIWRTGFQTNTKPEVLYHAKEGTKIKAAGTADSGDSFYIVFAGNNQYTFEKYNLSDRTTEHYFTERNTELGYGQSVLAGGNLFCLTPSGNYFLADRNGIQLQGTIELSNSAVHHISSFGDSIVIQTGFRYDARSFQIRQLALPDLKEIRNIRHISLYGAFKAHSAKEPKNP